MNNTLIIILNSIKTLHELEAELTKRFGWLRFRARKEYKELRNKIIDKINSLYNERWTIQYLLDLERILEFFYIDLEKYFGPELYIYNYNYEKNPNPKTFASIYFVDQNNNNHLIILDIISNNIAFRIMDTSSGNSFTVSSTDEVQQSQKKIESVCKHCLVTMIMKYLNREENKKV